MRQLSGRQHDGGNGARGLLQHAVGVVRKMAMECRRDGSGGKHDDEDDLSGAAARSASATLLLVAVCQV